MDSVLSNSDNKPTTNNNNSNKTHEHQTSSELFSSVKVLAEAAKGGDQKLDKDKVADASGDLLCAASQYGKLDETSGIGKSVKQAEEYLHNYNSSSSPSSHSSTNTNTNTNTSQSTPSTNTNTNTTNTSQSTPSTNTNTNTNTSHSNAGSDSGSQAESGHGGYMKMAEGLFKKH